jgi:phenylalanyl-tRNA synthetase beta chain
MKLPLSWLKEYVDIDLTAQELADKLLFCGFEVEEIIYRGKDIENVVAGKILSTEKHPNADKLIVCSVDVGKSEPVQIVTGADNVKAGDTVPVALDKSTLPDGLKIKEGKLRGVVSSGMLCSGEELKLSDTDYEGASVHGILIIKEDVKPGTDIKTVLGLDEYILDISITANRPDCQCVYGMAREIAALTGKDLKPLDLYYEEVIDDTIDKHISVQVKSPLLCPRYMAKCVKDIRIMPSPSYMQKRLRLCGIRPINVIVDVTNYIMLETGQPMHAFDERLIGDKKIVVRNAGKGETIVSLNGKENILSPEMLVICDAVKPVAVAGIMGGENSGINEATTTVIFEAAKFSKESIRKTSRKLGLFSDSSARFEKGIDAASCEVSLKRAMALIYKTGCGKIVNGLIDVKAEEIKEKTISVNKTKLLGVLGINVPDADILNILNKLEIKTEICNETVICIIPPFREDVEGYPDIAEEIIRFYGYGHLTPTLLKTASVIKGGRTEGHKDSDRLKDIMAAQGFNEVLTYAFINPDTFDKLLIEKDSILRKVISLKNPLSEQISVMRTTLVGNMLNVIATNTNRKITQGRLYELASVYLPKELPLTELPQEKLRLCFAAFGEKEDFYTLKGYALNVCGSFGLDIELKRGNYAFMHGGRCADIYCSGENIGFFGEVHPDVIENYGIRQRVYIAEIDYDKFKNYICYYKGFKALPKYPEVDRDLAMVVRDNVTCGEIIDTIKQSESRLLKSVSLFDIYKGGQIEKGYISMAFSLVFYDDNKTLTVEEVDSAISKILNSLKTKYNAQLRQ